MDNVLAPGLFTAKIIVFAYGRTTKLSTKIKARENKKDPFPQNIQPDTEVIRGFKIPWGMFQDKTQTTAMTEIVCVCYSCLSLSSHVLSAILHMFRLSFKLRVVDFAWLVG